MPGVNLIKECGGDKGARLDFINALNSCGNDNHCDETAKTAWQNGFNACYNIFHQAVRKGDLTIIIHRSDGGADLFIADG